MLQSRSLILSNSQTGVFGADEIAQLSVIIIKISHLCALLI